jgi:molecular chaperone GrpE
MSDRDAEDGVGTEQVEDAVLEEGEGAEPEPEQGAIEEGEPSLEEVLAKVREEAAAHYDRYLRTAAELDNFRKRTARMRSEVREDTMRDMLLQIAPGLDNMRRALDQDTEDVKALKQGIELIYSQLNGALEGYGLKLIDAVDQTFDPNIHEAMVEVEDAERAPGTVIEEMEKGYTLNGKVVRPARVIVSKAPSEGE